MNTASFRALLLAVSFAMVGLRSVAEQPKLPAPGPIPAQIGAAHKIFVSNVAEMNFDGILEDTELNGGPDRIYDAFYSEMKESGRYELVSSPADADLVVELGWSFNDTACLNRGSFLGQPDVLGKVRMAIVDPKTHITLWNLVQSVHGALQLGNRDKNFDQAMIMLVNRFKLLANPQASADAARK